ncbi:MAG TPA: ABC transporter substrate-binding protein [Ktedonobacteraceae bacterium]|nr:ABC transporter substrate-binding protein [Ktedonobacteraceae bacterium]
MTQNSSNTPKQPTLKLARLISFVGLLLLFLIANQPFNLAATLVFVVALLAVDLYQPIVQQVDRLDTWLYRGLQLVRRLYKKLQPVRKLLFRPVVRTLKYIHRHLGRIYNVVVTSILIGLVIFLIFQRFLQNAIMAAGDFTCVHTSLSPSFCDTGIGVVPFPSQEEGTSVNIGLIAKRGDGPFDTSRMRDSEMQVENLIFDEDARVSAVPHITLAVVTMLSRTADDNTLSANVGLEDLRGAYLAQSQYNSARGNGVKLRLVIANLGTRLTTQDEQKGTIRPVLERLILYSKYDPTFRGIVGFPFSQAAKNALDILEQWQPSIPLVPLYATRAIPLVSPSAMTDVISNEQNFYRVVSSNHDQSSDMLDFLVHEFKTEQQSTPVEVAVFLDSSDAYSANLGGDFINAARNGTRSSPTPNTTTFTENYQVQNASSLKDAVTDALRKNADFIFFAGYSYDIDTLENQLQAVQQQQQGPYKSIPILAGEGIYGLDRYAVTNPYSIVYSAVYASPVGVQDPFTQQYNQSFGPTPVSSFGSESYSLLPPHAILSYEATRAFLQTLDNLVQRGEDLTQENMNAALATVSFNGPSFNGQYDTIVFQGGNTSSQTRSNPPRRTDYVMCTDRNRSLHLAAKLTPGQPPEYRLHDVSQCV